MTARTGTQHFEHLKTDWEQHHAFPEEALGWGDAAFNALNEAGVLQPRAHVKDTGRRGHANDSAAAPTAPVSWR